MTARILTACLLALATVACGTPSRDDDDDDILVDAGTQLDAGDTTDAGEADAGDTPDAGEADAGEADAGEADAGEEPCLEGACSVDVSGTYSICAVCQIIGQQGPFVVDITNVCGCDFEVCQGGTNCQPLQLDTNVDPPAITVNVSIQGITATCTGPYVDGEATVTCATALGDCPGQLLAGTVATCPAAAP